MRIDRLDALRGIAALVVVIQHAVEQVMGRNALAPGIERAMTTIFADSFNFGRFGIAMFFLISGFVIPFSLRGPRPLWGFAVSRFFRLYPAYWLSLAFGLWVLALTGRDVPDLATILANASMFQAFVGRADIVPVYWTLALELLFYGACAALYGKGWLGNARIIALAIGLLLVAALALSGLSLVGGRHWPANIPFNLSLMFMGTLTRQAWLERDAAAQKRMPIMLAATMVALPLIQWGACFGSQSAYIQPIPFTTAYAAALVLFLLVLKGNWQSGPLWLWLGSISYSVYLVHGPWLQAMVTWFQPLSPATAPLFLAAVIVLTLGSAHLVYRLVERPCLRIGHGYMARLRAHAPAMAKAAR